MLKLYKAPVPIAVFAEPTVIHLSVPDPSPTLEEPAVALRKELNPTAVFAAVQTIAVSEEQRAFAPIATCPVPALFKRAFVPTATLEFTVVLHARAL